ncbi:MAG TPA: hypothetical protein VGA72_00255 [Anaerolineales bacterium]
MPTRRILLRRFAFLFGGVLVFLAILARLIEIHEEIYQRMRGEGWTTYLQDFHQDGSVMCGLVGTGEGDLILDPAGRILATGACSGLMGLHSFDGTEWTNYNGSYWDLAVGPDGKVWAVSMFGGSLDIFDERVWKTYDGAELGLGDQSIIRVEVDSNGRIWIVSRDDRVDTIIEILVSPDDVISLKNPIRIDSYLNSFDADGQGRIWAAVDRAFPKADVTGISVFDGETLQPIPDQGDDLKHAAGTALDPQGHLWVVTRCGGLIRYDSREWSTLIAEKTFPDCSAGGSRRMLGIRLDDQGRAWVWNYDGVYFADGNRWVTLTPENSGIAGSGVFGLVIDDAGRVWIGSSGGVSMAALPDAQPLPEGMVGRRRAVLYVKSWLQGMTWFLPSLAAGLWLATYFNVLPGVLLAVVLGLLYIVVGVGIVRTGSNVDADRLLALTGVVATYVGMLGGIIGALIDRRTGAKASRAAFGLAILGLILGAVATFLWVYFQAVSGG